MPDESWYAKRTAKEVISIACDMLVLDVANGKDCQKEARDLVNAFTFGSMSIARNLAMVIIRRHDTNEGESNGQARPSFQNP